MTVCACPIPVGEVYDSIAEPVQDRLFFAGEATWRKHPTTAAGAYLSGLRAAGRIVEVAAKEAAAEAARLAQATSLKRTAPGPAARPPKVKKTAAFSTPRTVAPPRS